MNKFYNERDKLEHWLQRWLNIGNLYRSGILNVVEDINYCTHEISRFHVDSYPNVDKIRKLVERLDYYHQRYNRVDCNLAIICNRIELT